MQIWDYIEKLEKIPYISLKTHFFSYLYVYMYFLMKMFMFEYIFFYKSLFLVRYWERFYYLSNLASHLHLTILLRGTPIRNSDETISIDNVSFEDELLVHQTLKNKNRCNSRSFSESADWERFEAFTWSWGSSIYLFLPVLVLGVFHRNLKKLEYRNQKILLHPYFWFAMLFGQHKLIVLQKQNWWSKLNLQMVIQFSWIPTGQ